MGSLTGKVLLVVDSREDFLRHVAEALKRNPEMPRVISAGSGEKALQLLPLQPVRLIVTAYELNDMVANELVERTHERSRDMPFVVYVNPGDRRRHEIALWNNTLSAEYDAQAVAIEQQVLECLSLPEKKEKTQVTELPLTSAIERLTKERATVQLRIVSSEGLGVIEMESGEVVHAHTRTAQGETALKRMLTWPDTALELVHIMKTDSRTVFKGWQQVKEEVEEGASETTTPRPKPKPTLEKRHEPPAEPTPKKSRQRTKKHGKKEAAKVPQAPRKKERHIPPPPTRKRGIRRRWLALLFLLLVLSLAGGGLAIFLREPQFARAAREQIEVLIQRVSLLLNPPPELPPAPPKKQAPEQLTVDFPEELKTRPWIICNALTAWLPSFTESGNSIAVSESMFERLGLKEPGWVEVASPHGPRFGARVHIDPNAVGEKIYLRESMVRPLGMDPHYSFSIAVRPVSWPRSARMEKEVLFKKIRTMPVQYAETWYAAGTSLKTMREHGLLPGTYVIVRGPGGFQSAKIQLMDRGNTDELWLSKTVRDAVGAQSPKDEVKLFPKLVQPTP